MAPADQVPVIPVQYQTIWIDTSFGLFAMRLVPHMHARLLLRSHTQQQHHLTRWLGRGRRGEKNQRRLNSLESQSQSLRQNTLDLGERSLNCMRVSKNSLSSRGDQAEKYRQGFLFTQHQWRHLETGPQTIAACKPPRPLDRNPKILEHRYISTHRSPINLQPFCDFRPTEAPFCLQ